MPERAPGTTFRPGSNSVPGTGRDGRDAVPANGEPPYGGFPAGTSSPPAPESATRSPLPVEVRSALANAYRRVNVAFNRLPGETQEAMDIRYDGLDRAVDQTILRGDWNGAMAAIRAWRDHWLREFGRAAR